MNRTLQHSLALALTLFSTLGLASETERPCAGHDCLICPALSDPAMYDSSNMKLLSQITPGKNRWLFRSEVDLSNNFGIAKAMEPEFKRLMDAFKAKGTQMVVSVQPTRGLMHRDKLYADQMHGFDYPKARASLGAFLDQMRRNGAIVPDILPLIDNPPADYFFRRDHHWTPIGSQITARITADEILRQPFYKALTKKKYVTSPGVMLFKDGTMNLGLGRICGNNYGIQYMRGFETIPAESDISALFEEEAPAEVIMVGTSNSATRDNETKQFNFDGFIKEYLSVDILNFSLPGAGQDGSLMEYLLSDSYSPAAAPKMIIWELPANYTLDAPHMYRQMIPAVTGGCSKAQVLMSQSTDKPSLAINERIELLSNAGEGRKDLTGSQGFLDIRFSDKNVKDFYVIVYYDNGARDKIWLRRPAAVTGGQYYLELSRAPEFSSANVLSVFIEPTAALATPTRIDAQLCE